MGDVHNRRQPKCLSRTICTTGQHCADGISKCECAHGVEGGVESGVEGGVSVHIQWKVE